ncbi:hypothetical protein LXL04_004146 [Taraxacum kok-saghyz]
MKVDDQNDDGVEVSDKIRSLSPSQISLILSQLEPPPTTVPPPPVSPEKRKRLPIVPKLLPHLLHTATTQPHTFLSEKHRRKHPKSAPSSPTVAESPPPSKSSNSATSVGSKHTIRLLSLPRPHPDQETVRTTPEKGPTPSQPLRIAARSKSVIFLVLFREIALGLL